MRACLIASLLADEPRPWLHEAYDIAQRLGGDLLRMMIKARMSERGVNPPRQRVASHDLSESELRIIAMIEQGLKNRQIAAALRFREKTVESHLTRLSRKQAAVRGSIWRPPASKDASLSPASSGAERPDVG